RAPAAQTTGTFDIGMSTVRYDGFLASGAASVTPGVRWERPNGTLTARGTYLRFESGHRSLQGSVAGSFFMPAAHRWRGEFSAGAGASRYVDFASFWHAVGEARLHFMESERGAWVSGTAGRASYGSAPRTVLAAGAGAWLRLPELTLRVSPRHTMSRGSMAPRGSGADGTDAPTSARLEVQVDRSRPVRLVVHVADATRVEVAGDFTDWQPLALNRTGGDLWEVVLPITSGVHRLDIRSHCSACMRPAGTTP